MKFNVIDDFCVDAIVGQDFLNKYRSIIFEIKGEQPSITIFKSNISCTLAAAKVKSPQLFQRLHPTCKQMASKLRQFNQEDQIFIRNETKRAPKGRNNRTVHFSLARPSSCN